MDSQQARDIERFRWFSDGFVALHPQNPKQIIDVRYSMVPDEIDPLWMIELDPKKDAKDHVDYIHQHNRVKEKEVKLWDMLLDRAN